MRRRHPDEQLEQALCLTIVTNAVVYWNTLYISDGVDQLRTAGHQITDDTTAHLTPAQDDHINR